MKNLIAIVVKGGYAPLLSGGISFYLVQKSIQNNDWQLLVAGVVSLVASMVFFFRLKKLERSKDLQVLKTIESISQSVFSHYGCKLAESNAELAKPKDINLIMQTIVNLTKELSAWFNKKYEESSSES